MNDFNYLPDDAIYLDSACQSLRPTPVIDALNNYYTNFNSCGERVKYKWGHITDEKVTKTREKVLDYLKLSKKHYFVSFTLNTTYGINLLLNQLKPELFKKVITSDIEHNSPFLSTLAFSQKHNLPREIIAREENGEINLNDYDFSKALVVVNCASNIDGRQLKNLNDLIKKVHKSNGMIIIDAAQAVAHSPEILHKTDADAICFSAHKMYAPSLGVIVAKKDLIEKTDSTFIGGGMVDDVDANNYQLSSESSNHIYTKFEPGLQAFGEIIALGEAIDWLKSLDKATKKNLENNIETLYNFLKSSEKIHLINQEPSSALSFYIDKFDSHLLGQAFADENIMCRTGYFCCHYYLDHVKHYPPLIRFSLGYHNRPEDIEKVINILERALN